MEENDEAIMRAAADAVVEGSPIDTLPDDAYETNTVRNYFLEQDRAVTAAAEAAAAAEIERQRAQYAAMGYQMDDEEEDDGLNEFGLPRKPPQTPPGPAPDDQPGPGLIPFPEDDIDDVSDDEEVDGRPRIGPKTPPEPAPPTPKDDSEEPIQAEAPKPEGSDGELSDDDEMDSLFPPVSQYGGTSQQRARLRSPHSLQQRPQSPGRHRILDVSPHRRQRSRDVRKRQVEEKKKPYVRTDTTSKELTFPAIATQKCLSLLEFTEKRGLTITDEELLLVVRDCLELDKAMDNIIDKKDLMIKQLEEMRDYEYQKIKKIHANMPRHMQDVLKFDGKTVHIAQERGPMPSQPMPFSSSSSFMPSKYGPPFPHHMGMPPPGHAPPFPPPSMGVPPPPLGMPPPPMGSGGPPPFGMPPPISLLGPPPFNPGMHPPPGRDPLVRGNSPPGGINPMAFSTAPPGHKMPGMGEYSQPPPHTKPVPQQNPQMGRMTNNLSSMLTNALKAQVSKAQSTYNTGSPTSTPTKKPVPSLMSINIPGIPKPGPSGSQK